MAFLARREHTRQELALKLQRREHSCHSMEKVLDALREEGLQSDTRFAESYIRSRVAKGDGPIKIHAALYQRGVAQHIADACLAEAGIDWGQQLRALWRKKYHGEVAEDVQSRARQLRFLQSRGYPADLVFRLFQQESY